MQLLFIFISVMPKLNILPKKSWHVYSTANRERVRRDEEKARIEEEKRDEKAKKRERDFRLETLRNRAKERNNTNDNDVNESISEQAPPKHINLFEEQVNNVSR